MASEEVMSAGASSPPLADACTPMEAPYGHFPRHTEMYCGVGSDAEDDDLAGIRMLRLSTQNPGSEADTETEVVDDEKGDGSADEADGGAFAVGGPFHYRSGDNRFRWARESSSTQRAGETRRCRWTGDGSGNSPSGGGPFVVFRPTGRWSPHMCMNTDEVRACRDLGLELPSDWKVDIAPVALHATPPSDARNEGVSPVGSWHISSPGDDDPRDVKARLRVWAQAVALASVRRLGR